MDDAKKIVETVEFLRNESKRSDVDETVKKEVNEISSNILGNVVDKLLNDQSPDGDPVNVTTDTIKIKTFKGDSINRKNVTLDLDGTKIILPEGLGDNGTIKGITVVITDENPVEGTGDDLIFITPFVNVTIHSLFEGKERKEGVPIVLKLPRK